jgi:lipid-binding SYLF domain-containing protein
MRYVMLSALALSLVMMTGCESKSGNANAPATQAGFHQESQAALRQMTANDSRVQDSLNGAYAYAVFPDVGKAALGVGGAGGNGVVYNRDGQVIGTAKLNQASIGLQVGGETYSELVIFQNQDAFNSFANGNLDFGAQTSATLIKAGAAGAAPFQHGVAVYILPKGGLEAGVSVNGQKLTYYAGNNGM